MDALIGRDAELASLEAVWRSAQAGRPQLAVVWGRRRVGKTFLLSHLVQGKRAVYFGATRQAERVELARFAEAVARDLGTDTLDLAGGRFGSWEAALRSVAAAARQAPLIVVLDEVPYLADSTPGFASVVQAIWDHLPPGTGLMLVLTGSAVGIIESMLGAGGALRGRPTWSRRLDPLSAVGARPFLPDLPGDRFLEAYAACGGYPLHLRDWDPAATTSENLLRMAATPGGLLFEDALGMLAEELPDAGGYARILAAIGRGRTRRSEIADDADQRVDHPLDVLIRGGVVRRAVPIGAHRRARPIYEIDDPYLAFWFAVLYSDATYITGGQGSVVLERRQQRWQTHLGWIFEELARDHAVRAVQAGALPADLLIGRWWSSVGPPVEVDVLGLRGSRTALLGEARWQQSPMGPRDIARILAKVSATPDPIDGPMVAVWARGGLDPRVQGGRVVGFDLDQMLGP